MPFGVKKPKRKRNPKSLNKLVTSEAYTRTLNRQETQSLNRLSNKAKTLKTQTVQRDIVKPQQEKMDNDPLNLLGIGIVAQFNLVRYLITVFALFTLLSIPMIYMYSGYDAMRGTKKESYTASTLGNMGFSSSA